MTDGKRRDEERGLLMPRRAFILGVPAVAAAILARPEKAMATWDNADPPYMYRYVNSDIGKWAVTSLDNGLALDGRPKNCDYTVDGDGHVWGEEAQLLVTRTAKHTYNITAWVAMWTSRYCVYNWGSDKYFYWDDGNGERDLGTLVATGNPQLSENRNGMGWLETQATWPFSFSSRTYSLRSREVISPDARRSEPVSQRWLATLTFPYVNSGLMKRWWGDTQVRSAGSLTGGASVMSGQYRLYCLIGGQRRYLDINNRLCRDGTKAVGWSDNRPNVTQLWCVSNRRGAVALSSGGNRLMKLSDMSGNGSYGSAAVVWADDDRAAWARWVPEAAGEDGGNRGFVLHPATNLYHALSIAGSSTKDGATIGLYPDVGGENQVWYLEPTGAGYGALSSEVKGWEEDGNLLPPLSPSDCTYRFAWKSDFSAYYGPLAADKPEGYSHVHVDMDWDWWIREDGCSRGLVKDDLTHCFYWFDAEGKTIGSSAPSHAVTEMADFPKKATIKVRKRAALKLDGLAVPAGVYRIRMGALDLAVKDEGDVWGGAVTTLRAGSPDAWVIVPAAGGVRISPVEAAGLALACEGEAKTGCKACLKPWSENDSGMVWAPARNDDGSFSFTSAADGGLALAASSAASGAAIWLAAAADAATQRWALARAATGDELSAQVTWADGWHTIHGRRYYYKGGAPATGWLVDNRDGALERFWLGDDGAMADDELIDTGSGWAYAKPGGAVARGKWRHPRTWVTYLADNDGVLKEPGPHVTAAYDSGTINRYFVDEDAHGCVPGPVVQGGKVTCAVKEDGTVARSRWLDPSTGIVYLADDDGALAGPGWVVTSSYGSLQRYWVDEGRMGCVPGYSEDGYAHYTVGGSSGYVLRNGSITLADGKTYNADNDGRLTPA